MLGFVAVIAADPVGVMARPIVPGADVVQVLHAARPDAPIS